MAVHLCLDFGSIYFMICRFCLRASGIRFCQFDFRDVTLTSWSRTCFLPRSSNTLIDAGREVVVCVATDCCVIA